MQTFFKEKTKCLAVMKKGMFLLLNPSPLPSPLPSSLLSLTPFTWLVSPAGKGWHTTMVMALLAWTVEERSQPPHTPYHISPPQHSRFTASPNSVISLNVLWQNVFLFAFASSFSSINIDFTHVVIFFILFVYFSIKKLLEEEMLLSVLCESKSEVWEWNIPVIFAKMAVS